MEAKREKAIVAKKIAEKRMENGDFAGALRAVLEAQRLYPVLENISQMLTVCKVHCSAQNKNEIDWYRMVHVERFSDEKTVKKQYKKLSLLLHPDKNKFPGAEGAFKLIGEANFVLTDPIKREEHDTKCGGSCKRKTPAPRTPNASRSSFRMHVPGTFRTRCSSCGDTYLLLKICASQSVTCPFCHTLFVARGVGA